MLKRLLDALRGTPAPDFYLPGESEVELLPSGLAIQVLEPGSGRSPEASDTVTVRYVGWTPDGVRFDSSYPGSATFGLDRVIRGWTEGLQHLAEGGSARLVIPPGLAYGPRGAPPRIGPDATLVFHVALLRVGG